MKSAIRFLLAIVIVLGAGIAALYLLSEKLGTNNEVIAFLFDKPFEVGLVGTGSMYPTLYWDSAQGGPEDITKALSENKQRVKPNLFMHFVYKYRSFELERPKIARGDIISFPVPEMNDNFIKRVIAVQNDTLEIRDGLVILNGEKIEEPYTYKSRSTFGGKTIPECKKITVPEGKLVVMGDNRKLSLDSRSNLGFIDVDSVDFVLPFNRQDALKARFRKIGADEFIDHKISLNTAQFLKTVNEQRKAKGLKTLKEAPKLLESSKLRANEILDQNNFETKDSTGKSYFEKAMEKVGYSNVMTAEFILQGYYDAEELFALRLESKELDAMLNEKDYEELGISVLNKDVNGCPTQVTVVHFGGYIPATYSEDVRNSWLQAEKVATQNANQIKDLKDNDLYDQKLVDVILDDYEIIIDIAKTINAKIQNRLWLTTLDEAKIAEYDRVQKRIDENSKRLADQAKAEANKIKRDNFEKCEANWELYVEKKEDCSKFLK